MLEGRKLTRALLVWDLDEDVWFSDGLILLDFEGEQVEIVHQKFDEISMTWNTVDPAQPLDWAETGFRLCMARGRAGRTGEDAGAQAAGRGDSDVDG